MADFVFNVALGRVVELYRRVQSGADANGAILVVPLLASGLETDAVLKDKDSLADVVAGTTNEATAGGWNRKTLVAANLTAVAPNDTADTVDLDIPDQTWTAVASGNNSGKLLICYDQNTTTGTDADIVPLCAYDFAVTTDGNDVVAQVHASGFFGAS